MPIELHGETLVDNHMKSATGGALNLEDVRGELLLGTPSAQTRAALGKAARTKKAGWFKSVSWMEEVARRTVGPNLTAEGVEEEFATILADVFLWTENA
jgi:putative ATP-dependent endonuclease of the OLD family